MNEQLLDDAPPDGGYFALRSIRQPRYAHASGELVENKSRPVCCRDRRHREVAAVVEPEIDDKMALVPARASAGSVRHDASSHRRSVRHVRFTSRRHDRRYRVCRRSPPRTILLRCGVTFMIYCSVVTSSLSRIAAATLYAVAAHQ